MVDMYIARYEFSLVPNIDSLIYPFLYEAKVTTTAFLNRTYNNEVTFAGKNNVIALVCMRLYMHLTDFLKTNLTKFAVI